MKITAKRVYEPATKDDGMRILVDRLWPRGFSKKTAPWDRWMKDVAPSDALRRRAHARPDIWHEFARAYVEELEDRPEIVDEMLVMAEDGPLTLLFASRQEDRNNATVLRDFLVGKARNR